MQLSAMLSGASFGALLLGSAMVSAAPVTLQVCSGTSCWNGSYQIVDGTVVEWTSVEALDNASGVSVNEWEAARGLDVEGWTLTMDSDPFVTNNFTITNNTASTQTYILGTTMGVVPAIPVGAMQGSIGFSLTDNNGGGATLATSGASIYQGTIDGNVARTLWDPVTSFAIPFATTSSSTYFGFPVREAAPESIDTSIGILISFSLTSGDSVSFTSNFDVTPVPVPAAVWLFGSGLLGLFGLSRRKRH
ncbi:MAG: PEP-CTERM sorting domain-containing protein [Pseudomonadota bacterium]